MSCILCQVLLPPASKIWIVVLQLLQAVDIIAALLVQPCPRAAVPYVTHSILQSLSQLLHLDIDLL